MMDSTSDQELMALFAKRPQVIKPGLERMRAAMAELGDLIKLPPSLLVGGTNGKGSTAGFLWQMLSLDGQRVGLYSSPHLCHFAERIQHTHKTIDNHLLMDELCILRQRLSFETYEALSFFELTTLLAFVVFTKQPTDIVILEVGMGGRYDATNVVDPILSVITSIGLDHMEYLGSTITAIALEKAGIMRQGKWTIWGGPAVSGELAHQTILNAATALGARVKSEGSDFAEVRFPDSLSDAPNYLRSNFSKAAEAYSLLRSQGKAHEPLDALLPCWHQAPMPPTLWARFQRLRASPSGFRPRSLILDVAHNPQGAQVLIQGLQRIKAQKPEQPIWGVISILGDKDVNGILDELCSFMDRVLLFASASERSFKPYDLNERHRGLVFNADFNEAWRTMEQAASDQDPLLVISGSVYALGEVLTVLGLDPLRQLGTTWR